MTDFNPKEYKVVALRDCPMPTILCTEPQQIVDYWRTHIIPHPQFSSECECLVVMLLNTRYCIKGHQLLTIGTMDTILVDPRVIFRSAIIAGAYAIALIHNHPSGDPSPSQADIKVTQELIRAAKLLKIEIIDHIIMGNPEFRSLRELGYFYQ